MRCFCAAPANPVQPRGQRDLFVRSREKEGRHGKPGEEHRRAAIDVHAAR